MMLAGAAAISIPIVLHLFYRSRYKPWPWAAMDFLRQAIEQTSRRLRLQELILLLLRCLAIVLLAVAFARPGGSGWSVTGRGQAVDAVLLVDVSYSMGAADGALSRLERAQQAAVGVLESLPPNSSVQVVCYADRAWLLGPQQRFNLDQARLLVQQLTLTDLGSDLLPGLQLAWEAACAGTAAVKEIYVLTDLQRLGWERNLEALRSLIEQIRQQGEIVFIQCGHPQREPVNVQVEQLRWTGIIPHTRTRLPFAITLRNTGSVPVRGLRVKLDIDESAVDREEVLIDRIEPAQSHSVTLTVGLGDKAGMHVARVHIQGDELPGDNVRYLPLWVRDKIRVLLVDGTPNPDDPARSASHFVRTALNPGNQADHFIETEIVSATEATPRRLDDIDVVYLLNAPVQTPSNPLQGLSSDFLDELVRFVHNGGGLIIAAGHQVDPFNYDAALGAQGRDLLPLPLIGKHQAPQTDPFRLDAASIPADCFLADFRQPGYAEALERLAIFNMLAFDTADTGRVLIRDTARRPYLAQRHIGAGEVLLLASSLDESWCHFSADPGSFHVPMAMLTLRYLTGRRQPGGLLTAGDTLTWMPPAPWARTPFDILVPPPPGEKTPQRYTLTSPRAQQLTAATAPQPTAAPAPLTWSQTFHSGVYRLVPQDSSVAAAMDHEALFVVNPPTREGAVLTTASPQQIAEWLGYSPVIVPAGADTAAAIHQQRHRSEWTEYVLLIVLAVIVLESAWAWWCGQAW
jgi:hypothetical protein